MPESTTRLSVKTQGAAPSVPAAKAWQPFETLRHEIDRIMDEFDGGGWMSPFRRSVFSMPRWARDLHQTAGMPAVDIAEKDSAYEITVELPGMDEKDIEVNLANGGLTIKGEKQDQKEEKKKDYYLQERHYGAFERSFHVPEGVDKAKIEAAFKNGVLTLTLPKSAETKQAEKKIAVKAV
jgi:HSP20 family protein